MFDHVTIRVADRAASEELYATILEPLGTETTYSTAAYAEWHDFSLTQTDASHPVARNLHVAFVASRQEQVDQFWEAGRAAGMADDGPPGPRTEYMEDYYGAFLRDPDGNSVEAVHHGKLRREGIIDHLWLRVADVAAAAVFYKLIAPTAGYALTHEGAERVTFRSPTVGGSFSLVPAGDGDGGRGALTENVHIAFPGAEEEVRRFFADATGAGYRPNGEPGERPQYHPGYYAAYVFDPDGNNIEVVDHHRG